jgi:hypothetical protein
MTVSRIFPFEVFVVVGAFGAVNVKTVLRENSM